MVLASQSVCLCQSACLFVFLSFCVSVFLFCIFLVGGWLAGWHNFSLDTSPSKALPVSLSVFVLSGFVFLFSYPGPLLSGFYTPIEDLFYPVKAGAESNYVFRFIFVKFQTPKSSTLIALMDLRVWITRHVVNSLAEDSAAVLCQTLYAVRTTSTVALADIGITTSQFSFYLKLHVGGMWLSFVTFLTWKTTSCRYGWLPSGFLPSIPVRRFCDSQTISSPSDLFKFKIRLDSKKEERKMENLYLMFSLSFKEQNV